MCVVYVSVCMPGYMDVCVPVCGGSEVGRGGGIQPEEYKTVRSTVSFSEAASCAVLKDRLLITAVQVAPPGYIIGYSTVYMYHIPHQPKQQQ